MKNKQAFIASIYIGLSMHIRFSKVTSYGCAVSQLTTSRGASHLDHTHMKGTPGVMQCGRPRIYNNSNQISK